MMHFVDPIFNRWTFCNKLVKSNINYTDDKLTFEKALPSAKCPICDKAYYSRFK